MWPILVWQKNWIFWVYIYKFRDLIIIIFPFNEKQLQQQLRAFSVFIQLHIMMYLLFLHRPQQPPPAPPAPPPPPARQRDLEEGTTCGSGHGYYRERRGGDYHNIMAELYATDIPGFTIHHYMRMTPEFFEMIKTRLEPCLARQATNYRAPISVGEKLALTIRYLDTGESYTSLSCQSRVTDPPFPSFYKRSAGPSRMSSPESTSDVLLLQMSGKNWKGNSGSGGMFHMPWEPWMASMRP